MAKVNDNNYITIQGWMINQLKLKGNELLIYALIYGFTQDEEQKFNGSLQYIADWTNSTKSGVIKNIKKLVDKGLIVKETEVINGVTFCKYHTTKFDGVCNKVVQGIQQSCMGGMQQSCTNNNILDNTNDINNNIIYIVNYLNKKTGFDYKSTTPKTRELIKARINEGFTVDDFKKVIDNKTADWLEDKQMVTYLRPVTLFGTKFESYLNQTPKQQPKKHTGLRVGSQVLG